MQPKKEGAPMEEYEVNLADYLGVLWKEKWVVIVTFLVAVATALAVSYSLPKQYQVETALLIPPLAQDVGGQVTGTVYSPETYQRLAIAGDLLQEVIQKVYPQGTSLTVASLRQSMKVEVEQTTANFPLYLRVTFTGSDREDLSKLAEAWAQAFMARSTELFLSRTAQSLTYVSQTFVEVEQDLLAKQEALKMFLQENPEPVLQAEVNTLRDLYSAYLRDLADAQEGLAAAQAKLTALWESLAAEPEHFVLVRAPSDEAIWQFLGTRPDPRSLAAYAGISLTDQVLNSTYVSLRGQVASTEAEVASLNARVTHLQRELSRTKLELEQMQARLVEVQTKRAQMEQEIAVLKDTYNRVAKSLLEARIARAETAEPIRIVEAPVLPTTPIGPNKKMNVAVAGVLGLFVGVLLAFVVHSLQVSVPKEGEGQAAEDRLQGEEK